VRENSESPDGQYGILVASMDAWEKDETLEETNYLANLKNHRLMGKIREQIEWLKKRDAAGSVEEKCKSMEARIKALQELVW